MGGKSPAVTCAILKRQGMKRGVPDVMIFERWVDGITGLYGHGLALELKSPRGRLTPEQKEWLAALEKRGWLTAVCRTIQEVVDVCEAIR
jgi:hypothetical protein